jgi:hypothetical protein
MISHSTNRAYVNAVSKTSVFGTLFNSSQNGEKWLFLCAKTRIKIKVPKPAPF